MYELVNVRGLTVFSFSSLLNADSSETNSSRVLHFVDGDKDPMESDNSFDLFDSSQAVTPKSGTKLKSG